jgi:hypothetical protein
MSRSRHFVLAGVVGVTAALVPHAAAAGSIGGESDPVAASGQGRVLLIYNCERGRYKPRRVIVTCADANFRVRSIRWSSWTRREARGRGTALVNDCDPNCAQGTFRRYRIRLRAFRPRLTGGCVPGSLFTRLGWRFPQRKPRGTPGTGRTRLVCPPSGP